MFPTYVKDILSALTARGFAAYVVGGCVRDLLLHRTPSDWDMTTNALPEQVLSIFDGFALPTGLKHGTVTVRLGGGEAEVTTFRRDGAYLDHRHPSQVCFTGALREDLARRDFTVNAMAMDAHGAVTDCFGGQADLRAGILRCVGDPAVRFSEDALRILRALRFAAVYGFSIEAETARAVHEQRALLRDIAAERVFSELTRLLCGAHITQVLLQYPDVLGVWIPEILPCVGFDQKSRYHIYDVWEHTVRAMAAVKPVPYLRWHMLFHDLGKPAAYTEDAQGRGHTYGHTARSAKIAEPIMARLRFDSADRDHIRVLLKWHDAQFRPTEGEILSVLSQIGPQALGDLLDVKRADNAAKRPENLDRAQRYWNAAEVLMGQLLAQGACYTVAQLAVNGEDLLALGYSGRAVGAALQRALVKVMAGEVPNERDAILTYLTTADGGQNASPS